MSKKKTASAKVARKKVEVTVNNNLPMVVKVENPTEEQEVETTKNDETMTQEQVNNDLPTVEEVENLTEEQEVETTKNDETMTQEKQNNEVPTAVEVPVNTETVEELLNKEIERVESRHRLAKKRKNLLSITNKLNAFAEAVENEDEDEFNSVTASAILKIGYTEELKLTHPVVITEMVEFILKRIEGNVKAIEKELLSL